VKILLVHNFYQQSGGEDACFSDEGRLLEEHGHEVVRYTLHNDAIKQDGAVRTAARAFWSRDTYRKLSALIARERPAVMHCTNTFPLISPSAYYAARRQGVAVVQALHNYRLVCPGSLLMRDGAACEDCLGKAFATSAIRHGCYRGSRAGSAVVAAMIAAHRARRTWRRAVDRYYALTQFARGKFIAGGLPAEKLMVKPNFVFPFPAPAGDRQPQDDYCIFVGRLSVEKGILTALEAWREFDFGPRLVIVGDGPLAEVVRRAAAGNERIEWLGALPNQEAVAKVRAARALVVPSLCYENFPRSIVESFAVGTPVIASRQGAMQELVDEGGAGTLFAAGDARDLAAAAARIGSLSRDEYAALRDSARREYQLKYTPEENYRLLVEIYRQAVEACTGTRPADDPSESSPLASAENNLPFAAPPHPECDRVVA
jgi:glycosyltransferase involved in cell wall biosynthesis